MKNVFIIAVSALMIFSCSSKKPSKEYIYAASLHQNYADYYYKGEKMVADITFYKGVDSFIKMDSFCNASRMYISRFALAENEADKKDALLALEYAEAGACEDEALIANFLLEGQTERNGKLEKPFSLIAEFYESGRYSAMLSYADSNSSSFASSAVRIYRLVAEGIVNKEPKKALEIVTKAHEIDTAYGWTLGIYRDLEIMIKAQENLGADTESLAKRKQIIKQKLGKN